ncbi:YopX family protein [Enterococcus sp. AZ192]|uniref:YopX family protein n=1 Tax=unclassified Enterococcus TaxID=2608891 RepID=UPI003D2B94DD
MNKPKFRAWDEERGMMKCHGLFQGCTIAQLYNDDYQNYMRFLDEIILMQYTGLNDKNGVEIYEGDIIKGPHDFGPAGFHQRTGVVTFTAEYGYQWEYWLINDIEVIGSIHENPELLSGVE